MNNRTAPSLAAVASYAQLLQDARDQFAMGVCIEAAEKASEAILLMEGTLSFAANNPQLADAYALQAAICTEVHKTYHGDDTKQLYLRLSLDAYRSEIACRALGCETEALAKAHFLYGRTLAANLGDSRGYQEIAKAMKILATLADRDGEIKTPWLY
jgi:hypothetical protein